MAAVSLLELEPGSGVSNNAHRPTRGPALTIDSSFFTSFLLIALSLLICQLSCHLGMSAKAQLDRVALLFQHGHFIECESSSAHLASRLQHSDPLASAKFTIWQAEAAYWRGNYQEALSIASSHLVAVQDFEIAIRRHAIAAIALAHLHRLPDADKEIAKANQLCATATSVACGELLRAQGGLALERGDANQAYRFYSQSLLTARQSHQRLDEATALMNLSHASLLKEKPDEAIDWSNAAIRLARELDATDVLMMGVGNLGWAYYTLGDSERALVLFRDAQQRALVLNDDSAALLWLMTSARINQDNNDLDRADRSYHQALDLATQMKSKEDQITALEELAHVALQGGSPDRAEPYLDRLEPLVHTNGNRLDALAVMLARGKSAALRHNYLEAQNQFQIVESDPSSQTSMKLGAQHELARLAEQQGQTFVAADMYQTALTSFESAREQLTEEDSKLPFLANATGIYDDYIQFLVAQGKVNQALEVADQSRAQTLAHGLGQKTSSNFKPLDPRLIAKKADATLLFYWLGTKQSYLWTISKDKTTLFNLPSQHEISKLAGIHRNRITGPEDPLQSHSETAASLYTTLIAPASTLINRDKPVMILADGELSQLNFETLLVPGPSPHYWIEDVTLEAAPSLSMLAAAQPSHIASGRLLMFGNAISADDNYPELPRAAEEMKLIPRHFTAPNVSVFARQQATPATYFASNPERYAYIHFVAHGVASLTDPLDSAIILSQPTASQSGFKLYAREIMQHPIDAHLVTISACYGTGIRAYAGEGLVGLSWAFLRAGAHNTIGAMWEASDKSTPLLMDSLYQGLQQGQAPATALRNAKLSLLHSHSIYQRPFYWAPFQIYTRL